MLMAVKGMLKIYHGLRKRVTTKYLKRQGCSVRY